MVAKRRTGKKTVADPEQVHEIEVLQSALKESIKESDLPTLRVLLRVVRFAEEGKTPVAVTLEDLRDPLQRKILLQVYGASQGAAVAETKLG